jgi:hypothetical protein
MVYGRLPIRSTTTFLPDTPLLFRRRFLTTSPLAWFAMLSARRKRRMDRMDGLHEMLVEDEIVFCGLVLLLGIVTGAVARCVAALRGRRAA